MAASNPVSEPQINIKICDQIENIAPETWNTLVTDNNPFLRHEFLSALERYNCVGEHFGWLPSHIAIYDGTTLVGAMPFYEKHNAYGEFVFDHTWSDAYQRAGLRYYPKYVSAIPYTPATGQRLLCKPEYRELIQPLLLQTAMELTRSSGAGSFHILFPPEAEHSWLESNGLITRHDCQFLWHNQNYRDFDHFLETLNNRKRKNIRQERRRVQQSNIKIRRLNGHTATDEDWQHFSRFYNRTFEEKWGMATFNLDFFRAIANALPEQIILVLADHKDRTLAGALMYRSDSILYGRHWGCDEQIDSLHFEACYYQGIEYAIENGLRLFEPGAQGEHKIARGFVPTLTRSSHWLTDEAFKPSIRQFCLHEQAAVAEYMSDLQQHLPYKKTST